MKAAVDNQLRDQQAGLEGAGDALTTQIATFRIKYHSGAIVEMEFISQRNFIDYEKAFGNVDRHTVETSETLWYP